MSSILTNNSAMVALQTLKSVNQNLAMTQSEISTGKSIATAKDNSAVWAISKVMESDVAGFKAISDSLNLGESTVAVARNASESITDLLTQMKGKIVAAQEDNVDRTKIQDDIVELRNQIGSVVSAAQFNGLNLVDGNTATADILSSLDRDSTGTVTSSSITVLGQDLSTGGYTASAAFTGTTGASGAGDVFGFSLDDGASDDVVIVPAGLGTVGTPAEAGAKIGLTIGDQKVSYTVTAADLATGNVVEDNVAAGLKSAIDALGLDVDVAFDGANTGTLNVTNNTGADLAITGTYQNAGSGGLGALASLDVSTDAGAAAALGSIETLIGTAIDASAAFGSAEGRIETQQSFISNLTDSLKSGIGAMVDANMEEASARLQALQTQQQLAVQALSIANQAPQTILQLFR